jgi:NAD+ synthase (glutamine-hydrolysing)
VYHSFLETLDPIFNGLPFSLAEENIQSRSRGNILMAIANKLGYVLLNTSNKSELATGYGTLYGDMAGGLGVLGDLYKMQVYELAKYINREKEIIPTNIISQSTECASPYHVIGRLVDHLSRLIAGFSNGI